MPRTSNQHQIYLCLYFEQGPAGTNAIEGLPRVFHIGLWVQPKGSKSKGHSFDVRYQPSYSNRPEEVEGWKYETSVNRSGPDDLGSSGGLIAIVLLGKLPDGVRAEEVHGICEGVRLPGENENCWDWTGRAVGEINKQGYLDLGQDFSWNGFRDRTYAQACRWWVDVDKERIPRTPHYWDIFETESGQCTIL